MGSIVILASCEYQFIVVHENLVQHPRKDRFRLLAKVNIVLNVYFSEACRRLTRSCRALVKLSNSQNEITTWRLNDIPREQ